MISTNSAALSHQHTDVKVAMPLKSVRQQSHFNRFTHSNSKGHHNRTAINSRENWHPQSWDEQRGLTLAVAFLKKRESWLQNKVLCGGFDISKVLVPFSLAGSVNFFWWLSALFSCMFDWLRVILREIKVWPLEGFEGRKRGVTHDSVNFTIHVDKSSFNNFLCIGTHAP